MKRMWIGLSAALLVAALVVPGRLAAKRPQGSGGAPYYLVIDLGNPNGGTASGASSINNIGWASGFSEFSGNQTMNTFLWFLGLRIPIGTFGGPNSSVVWPVKNDRGILSGIAETADLNPLQETWSCSAFFPTITLHDCRGFRWENGILIKLSTLGGYNSFAAGTNNNGVTVGWAENTVHDPTCTTNPPFHQVLQFKPAYWNPDGSIHALPLIAPNQSGAATEINDNGQMVGISGDCDVAVGALTARHAVLWDHGQVIDIGNLGGAGWNTPMAINNNGVVVGFSDLSGDESTGTLVFNSRAFVWSKQLGKMMDLGVLYNDSISQATGINDQGQIVGVSFPSDRPFIYESGKMTDLNDFIDPSSPYLLTGNVDVDINDLGEIVGQACVLQSGVCTGTSATPAFRLIPTHGGYQLSIGTSATNAAGPSDGKSIEPGALALMLASRRSMVRFAQVPPTQQ